MIRGYIVTLILSGSLLWACDDNAVFEKEMYKNEVALISSDYHNTFQEIVHLTGEDEIEAYVAASAGGTMAPSEDLVIMLEEDPEPLFDYNWSVYDADERMYAKPLPKNRIEIPDSKIVSKAGERTGRTMIKSRPNGLSPDSTYFIGLKATESSRVEINPKKSTMLYQVLIKNDFASPAENVFYSMTGMVDGM